MTAPSSPLPRERILQSALRLLDEGGVQAVSTRTVSAAAEVQPPTIYRHFGDMQGLLDAAASAGFTAFVEAKAAQVPLGNPVLGDPVDQLRAGWRLHVEFGLGHPHLYLQMLGSPRSGTPPPAVAQATEMLRSLMGRVAQGGRLALSVDAAAQVIHAAVVGTTMSLLGREKPDAEFSELMLSAVLKTVLTPETTPATDDRRPRAALYAVSLAAVLPEIDGPFSQAERRLLEEWLERLM